MVSGLLLIQPHPIGSGIQGEPPPLSENAFGDAHPQKNDMPSCARCHKPDGTAPVADYRTRGECAECHMPLPEGPLPLPEEPLPLAEGPLPAETGLPENNKLRTMV